MRCIAHQSSLSFPLLFPPYKIFDGERGRQIPFFSPLRSILRFPMDAFSAAVLIVGGLTVKNVLDAAKDAREAPYRLGGDDSPASSKVRKSSPTLASDGGGGGCCGGGSSSKKGSKKGKLGGDGCCGAGNGQGGCCREEEDDSDDVTTTATALLSAMNEEMPLVSVDEIMAAASASSATKKKGVAFVDAPEEGDRKWIPKRDFVALRKAGVLKKGSSSSPSIRQRASAAAKSGSSLRTTDGRARPPVLILFATQSGNAETFAHELHEEAVEKGFDSRVVNMSSFNPDTLPNHKFVIFVVPTWHEGR